MIKTVFLLLSLSCFKLKAGEASDENGVEVKAEEIDLNLSPSDDYLPNILTSVLMSHSESRTNRIRAGTFSAANEKIFVPVVKNIYREGENFQIQLNEWHAPFRFENEHKPSE
ncbi:MAG: hypothetical protein EOP04_03615 [Proteobacteria bacterium]|nr:MAG: hypothetical protein EOP04_03615 [Pseudomonadota bacterium]